MMTGVSAVADKLLEGLTNAALMAWEVWWALVLGFAISALVQAWIPRERVEKALAGGGATAVSKATALGAASSSCSYAAIAIARSLFAKGASAVTALAFQFASTNLVWEIGLVLWVLLGWQFTLAEYLGGILMIILIAVMLRLFISPKLEEIARANAEAAAPGHQHHMAGSELPLKDRIRSSDAWSDVAHNFRGDWQMLWKEIVIGFLLAGYIALLGQDFFNGLFLVGETGFWPTLWNVIVGPLIAVASFVCSIGNIPLAGVLWSGGISFAGVLAFIFADLIVFPIILAYRKYYGWKFTVRIVALMFVTMVLAALAIDGLFSVAGIIPTDRPSTEEVFGMVKFDYKAILNIIALVVFAALIAMTIRRGATDPVCGMKVDKSKGVTLEIDSGTVYFCSEHCHHQFEADPRKYASG